MARVKVCDLCISQTSSSDVVCLKCGGTSFTWRESNAGEADNSQINSGLVRGFTSNNEHQAKSVMDILFSINFDDYVTKPIIRFVYALTLIGAALAWVFSLFIFWNLFGVGGNSDSGIPFLLFMLSEVLLGIFLLAQVALTRVALEGVNALIEIAVNTRKPAKL